VSRVTAAPAVCTSCGAVQHEGARFCAACGVALSASVEAAEYKHVTVLFADVVRSMGIAAAVDVERFREIMIELVERSAAVVRRYGGTVDYTGDGVMAVFGAPVALEDHAFRACLAGLAIQEETSRLAAEVQRHDGVALQVRPCELHPRHRIRLPKSVDPRSGHNRTAQRVLRGGDAETARVDESWRGFHPVALPLEGLGGQVDTTQAGVVEHTHPVRRFPMHLSLRG
jgi:Adenylate and Guanylate cyclase catalytic domain